MNSTFIKLCLKSFALVVAFSLINCSLLEAAKRLLQGTLIKIRLQNTLSTRSTKEFQPHRQKIDITSFGLVQKN
jgi:hypothetical protein